MSRYWTETVRRLTPYVPGEQRQGADVVKLNTNENPYPPSPQVLAAMQSVAGDDLRRYPDPESVRLRTALADYHELAVDQVFVGNGSDEILALSFLAYFSGSAPLQYPDISYSFYPVYCDLYGIEKNTVPLDADFTLNLQDFDNKRGGIVFPNPNAPTACAVSTADIRALLERHTDHVVLVDEAYADLGAESVIPLIAEYPNLLVSHTFSKGRSLAGMRIGAAFGQAELIDGIRRVKNSFNSYPVDVVAERAAIASLQDEAYYRDTLARICSTRDAVVEALQQRKFTVLPSAANFIFVKPSGVNARDLFAALSEQSVMVRYWDKPPIDEWLRISIGTEIDMQRLLKVIDQVNEA